MASYPEILSYFLDYKSKLVIDYNKDPELHLIHSFRTGIKYDEILVDMIKSRSRHYLLEVINEGYDLDELLNVIECEVEDLIDYANYGEKIAIYLLMIYYANRNVIVNYNEFLYWAARLEAVGVYYGKYIMYIDEEDQARKISYLKEAADKGDEIAQYKYSELLDSNSKEYYKYLLASAYNDYEPSIYKAIEIFESLELYEEAFLMMLKLLDKDNDKVIPKLEEYIKKYKFKVTNKIKKKMKTL